LRGATASAGGDRNRSEELREILSADVACCHDFKAARGLHSVLDEVGHDTYLAAYLLAPGRRGYPLAELAREANLATVKCAQEIPDEAVEAALAVELAACQEPALREQGMWDLFQEVELPLTRVLIAMEESGIHLDCYRLGEITGKSKTRWRG